MDASVLVSAAFSDGTVLETVHRCLEQETAFVVGTPDGDIATQQGWEREGQRFIPVRGNNNLLKHRAVLLPSEVGESSPATELATEIRRYLATYVALTAEQIEIVTAFVLLSWVYDAFNELPYLRFRGDYGTGKTRALLVVGSICYKPFFASGASTVAPIFHTLDLFAGTLVLDEADFRFSDEKAELVKILNNGNVRGFPVLRMQANQRREFDPRAFRVFGPKIVAMRSSYEDRALESRFITLDMLPGRADGMPINLPNHQQDEALMLRNKLLAFRLRHLHEFKPEAALAEPDLEPRTNQILLPLLTVACSNDMRAAITGAARAFQSGVIAERAETQDGHILAIVKRLMAGRNEPLRIAEIAAALATQAVSEQQPCPSNRWIGCALRRLGIALYKRNGVSVIEPGQHERLAALFKRYGLGFELEGDQGV